MYYEYKTNQTRPYEALRTHNGDVLCEDVGRECGICDSRCNLQLQTRVTVDGHATVCVTVTNNNTGQNQVLNLGFIF